MAQQVKNLPAMQETQKWVLSLGWKDTLEGEIATHFNILAWEIPWTEDSDGLWSLGSQKNWTWLSDWACAWTLAYTNIDADILHAEKIVISMTLDIYCWLGFLLRRKCYIHFCLSKWHILFQVRCSFILGKCLDGTFWSSWIIEGHYSLTVVFKSGNWELWQKKQILHVRCPKQLPFYHCTAAFLQEIVKDRGTWRAAVHWVTKSRTWLTDWTSTTAAFLLLSSIYTHSRCQLPNLIKKIICAKSLKASSPAAVFTWDFLMLPNRLMALGGNFTQWRIAAKKIEI